MGTLAQASAQLVTHEHVRTVVRKVVNNHVDDGLLRGLRQQEWNAIFFGVFGHYPTGNPREDDPKWDKLIKKENFHVGGIVDEFLRY